MQMFWVRTRLAGRFILGVVGLLLIWSITRSFFVNTVPAFGRHFGEGVTDLVMGALLLAFWAPVTVWGLRSTRLLFSRLPRT